MKTSLGIAAVVVAVGAWLFWEDDVESMSKDSVLAQGVTPAASLPDGFVVWSSNRSGNHDIYRMTLPGKEITRLTDHPNEEYYPRISPDGKKIVFARSHKPGQSVRNEKDWDVIMLDLESGREKLIHEYGNSPTWSAGGRKIYFQYKVAQLGRYDLDTGEADIAFPQGRGDVNKGTSLQTPHMSPDGSRMAVTLRRAQRMTALVDMDGHVKPISGGCQITWGPGGDFVYFVDHGGRMQNAMYVYELGSPKPVKWFDMPGKFSHEYFPRLSEDKRWLVFGASRSRKEHEHDAADYENFLWQVGTPADKAVRLTFNKANDNFPDIHIN